MKWGYLQIFFMPCRVNIHILLQKYQYVWLRGAITHLAGGISEVTQSCLTLCDPSPPGSSIHGIFQARVLEWVAISCSSLQFKGSRFQNTPGTKCRVRNYEPEQSWKQKSRTQGWGWGLRAEDTNVRTVSAKVTLWTLSPDSTLGETTKGEVAKHQPWDAPSFEGYAKKKIFIPSLQKWTLRVIKEKWFAKECVAVMQLTGNNRLHIPGPPPGLWDVGVVSIGYRLWH